jgi:PAS domain S-box-containing protein
VRECSPFDVIADILDEVPDMVFAYSPDGCFLYVNREAASFLGAEQLDVIGRDWRDLGYPAEVMEPLISRVAEVFSTTKPVHYRLITSVERGSRTLDMSLTPLRCDGEGVVGVLAIAHDISEFF